MAHKKGPCVPWTIWPSPAQARQWVSLPVTWLLVDRGRSVSSEMEGVLWGRLSLRTKPSVGNGWDRKKAEDTIGQRPQ